MNASGLSDLPKEKTLMKKLYNIAKKKFAKEARYDPTVPTTAIVAPTSNDPSVSEATLSSSKSKTVHSSTITDTSSLTSINSYTSNYSEESFTLTDNTLSMISSPWITESWRSQSYNDSFTLSTMSSSTILPGSTTSVGIASLFLLSSSKLTYTVLNGASSANSSHKIWLSLGRNVEEISDTLSSWSLETFTSTGFLSGDETAPNVEAKHPCNSPTSVSYSDFYPTSALSYSNCSRETVATRPINAFEPSQEFETVLSRRIPSFKELYHKEINV